MLLTVSVNKMKETWSLDKGGFICHGLEVLYGAFVS